MKKNYLYVANWKMELTHKEVLRYLQESYSGLSALASAPEAQLIMCPSYESIAMVNELLLETPIEVGAQDCSAYSSGAHTGQVAAASLAQVGCTYCIVGHNEARTELHQDPEAINKKLMQLIEHGITPIICIGETQKEYDKQETADALAKQIFPLLDTLKTDSAKYNNFYLAYEPIWAIGSDKTPSLEQLDKIFKFIKNLLEKNGHSLSYKLLYGGSVNPENSSELKKIEHLDGFLIGRASLDFKKLEKNCIIIEKNRNINRKDFNMLYALLVSLYAFITFLMGTLILIQQSKGSAGLGALGGGTQMLFGATGGQDLFQKATWILGALFMSLSLFLAIYRTRELEKAGFVRTGAPMGQSAPAQLPDTDY